MPNIDKIAERPMAYLTGTGVPQLVSGLVFFFLGSSILIPRLFPGSSADYRLIVQITGTLCAGAVLLGAKALKQRLVFPRAGYAEPLQPRSRRLALIVALAAMAALSIVAMIWPGSVPRFDSRMIAPGFALAFAAICLGSGWREKSAATMWFGVYFICLAPLLWLLPVNNYEQMASLQVGAGGVLAVAGVMRLRRFLKANPRPAEMEQ